MGPPSSSAPTSSHLPSSSTSSHPCRHLARLSSPTPPPVPARAPPLRRRWASFSSQSWPPQQQKLQPEVGAMGRRMDKQGRRLEVCSPAYASPPPTRRGSCWPFQDVLWAHIHRLPAQYPLGVNMERADDMVTHQRLLEEARDPQCRLALAVGIVQAILLNGALMMMLTMGWETERDSSSSYLEKGIQ